LLTSSFEIFCRHYAVRVQCLKLIFITAVASVSEIAQITD